MLATRIRLRNFRNHVDTSLEFAAGINAILGRNGQGKTNILEAISYLSLTKSFYAANDLSVLQIGQEFFDIDGVLTADGNLNSAVHVEYTRRTGEKILTVNKSRPESLSSVIGMFPIVILSPEQHAITFGGPGDRRKFVDLLLSQVSRAYFEDLLEYRRVLKQRNRLLLDARHERVYSEGIIEPWTQSLIEHGSRIVQRRAQLVGEFIPYVERSYRDLAKCDEAPDLRYRTFGEISTSDSLEFINQAMEEEIVLRHPEERKRGTTLVGPHRDDVEFDINGISVRNHASQGQHKTFLIALKVAEFFYLSERRRELPIFLLDDVFSELDEFRSKNLLELVSQLGQTIITTTDETVFINGIDWLGENRKFYVEKGTCRQVG